jgi:hypothetical protein
MPQGQTEKKAEGENYVQVKLQLRNNEIRHLEQSLFLILGYEYFKQ